MRLAWLSVAIHAKTGYGRMSSEIVSRLMENHEVVSMANEGAIPMWGNEKETPLPDGKMLKTLWIPDPQTQVAQTAALVNAYCQTKKIDLIIAHIDAFCLDFLHQVNTPYIEYVPVDSAMTPKWAGFMRGANKAVLFSWYGYEQARRFLPASDLAYIPHGIDCSVFKPSDKSKATLRSEMAEKHTGVIPADAFLMAYTGANMGPRKNMPLLLRTFAKFAERHADAHIFLHTNVNATGHGYHLGEIISDLGIKDRVHYPKLSPVTDAITDAEFARLYNASDVFVSASSGEGFGLPLAEAAACGLPPIAPANSSQTELVKGHGWLVDCIDPEVYVDYPSYVPTDNFYHPPDARSLLAKMEEAYAKPETREWLGKRAREFALGYDWGLLMPKWERLLAEAESEIGRGRSFKEVMQGVTVDMRFSQA